MSSRYDIICASHDPALELDREYRTPGDAIADVCEHGSLADHRRCDLLVSRISGGLIAIGCPGGEYAPCGHRSDYWTDAGWLRLLYAAYKRGDDVDGYRIPDCWSRRRVLRLGRVLDMEAGR